MKKVVTLDTLKKQREERLGLTGDSLENSLENESYYFQIEDVSIEFGGAFARDLIAKKKENLERIKMVVSRLTEKTKLDIMEDVPDDSPVAKDAADFIVNLLKLQEEVILQCLIVLNTQQDMSDLFEEDSRYLAITPLLLTTIMAVSYVEFNYMKMEKDNYLKISPSIESLLNNKIYKEISELSDSLAETE